MDEPLELLDDDEGPVDEPPELLLESEVPLDDDESLVPELLLVASTPPKPVLDALLDVALVPVLDALEDVVDVKL